MRFWQILSISLVAMAVTAFFLWGLSKIAPWIVPPLLFFTALFLILLVLVQRGKGGGLAGAFGGLGGQSAFGTKAGDLFTRITIGVAAFWIILCTITVKTMGTGEQSPLDPTIGQDRQSEQGPPGATDPDKPAGGNSGPGPAGPAEDP